MDIMQDYSDLLTTQEACEALRIGYNTLYHLLHSGQLKGYRCGRVWRIPKVAIVDFILDSAKLSQNPQPFC